MIVFFIVYQQIENHLLQPLVYGRTVQLSPLAVLISILIGAELAGVLGALAAIPVAGSIQVVWSSTGCTTGTNARPQRSDPSFGGLPPAGGGPIASACTGTQGCSRCWPRCWWWQSRRPPVPPVREGR